jgi:hypothetical protein
MGTVNPVFLLSLRQRVIGADKRAFVCVSVGLTLFLRNGTQTENDNNNPVKILFLLS